MNTPHPTLSPHVKRIGSLEWLRCYVGLIYLFTYLQNKIIS